MEFNHLQTFVTVAEIGSITRAASLLNLSQPAISAHIKAMEEELDLTLFQRTARGMIVTPDGERLLESSRQAINARRTLVEEASRMRQTLSGHFRVGMAANAQSNDLSRLLANMARLHEQLDIDLCHSSSPEVVLAIREGRLDAGFYIEDGDAENDLTTIEVARFGSYLVAPKGAFPIEDQINWDRLANCAWVRPKRDTCCGRALDDLFRKQGFRPKRVVSIDNEKLGRSLIAAGVGVGILHSDTAQQAHRAGEIDIICQIKEPLRVLFAYLARRNDDPILIAATRILRSVDLGLEG